MQNSKKLNNQVASRFENDLEKLQTENSRLHSLLEVTNTLSSVIDLETLLFKIMDVVKINLHADRCTVFILDKEKNELWSKAAIGLKQEIRFPADKGIAGFVAGSGETLNIPDAYADYRFNPEVDKKTGYKTKNMLTMPMRDKRNEVIGVFQVLNRETGSFTSKDEELLKAISSIAAGALENALLYEEIRKSFTSFIETLSTTLDARDYITSGHSRRVTLYAVQISRLMRLEPAEINRIRYASLLHDIGKIGVPEIVLFKNKKLSDDEYEIIKRHASLTKSILSKIHFQSELKDVPEIASTHHEKIDGSGYPDGLTGTDIPLGGKILAVCDVFDALTSRRQYRDRIEIEKVMGIIDKETGTAFEPFVVYEFKSIRLNVLVEILEFGYNENLKKEDLQLLKNYSLKDIVQIRTNGARDEEQAHVEEVFMRYYLRTYRMD